MHAGIPPPREQTPQSRHHPEQTPPLRADPLEQTLRCRHPLAAEPLPPGRDGHCCRQYTSYWNAFLLLLLLPPAYAGRLCFWSCVSVCLCACLCVCLCVCLSVFLSVQATTFEPLHIETSFLVCRHILTISRSGLSIKVIGSRSRSYEKMIVYLFQLVNPLLILPTLCKILLILTY